MNIKPNSIIRVPCSSLGSFCRYWFMFLYPFFKLSECELKVISALLEQRFILSKQLKSDELIGRFLLSTETKKLIKEQCSMSNNHLRVLINELKNKNIIVNNDINPKYIPRFDVIDTSDNFKLMILFEVNNEVSGTNN